MQLNLIRLTSNSLSALKKKKVKTFSKYKNPAW